MLDLIILHHAPLGNDLLQEHMKLGNVPLSGTQGVKKPSLGLFGADVEGGIKGSARGDHPEILVEHEDRLANRIDDGACQGAGIRGVGKLFSETGRRHRKSPAPGFSGSFVWKLYRTTQQRHHMTHTSLQSVQY
jgi:hypothetical protein